MIKQRVKKVTYQVWEECKCGGRLKNTVRQVFGACGGSDFVYHSECLSCGETSTEKCSTSPVMIEEYEEINE